MNFTIKDRIAEGDDIFSFEHLEDGRIRLLPTPDAVIEQGTPVNKALLQPLVDISPNVYNIDFDNMLTGGEISFSEGQTASDLYSDISSGKPVIVTKNNDMFFVPTVRVAGEYILTCVSTYGMQWTFRLGQSSASAVIAEAVALDFVVNVGQSGSWKYRKWLGGTVECWGLIPLTIKSVGEISSMTGISAVSAELAKPSFVSSENATIQVTPATWGYMSAHATDYGSYFGISIYGRTNEMSGVVAGGTVNVNIHFTGTLKEG